MTSKDKVMLILAGGLITIIILLVVADFITSLETMRPPHAEIIDLIKMAITGIIGIIAGYFAGKGEHNGSK